MHARVLEVDRLTVTYDRVPAVRDVSFVVGAGRVAALLGANGAGKSTILRCLAGTIVPDAGRVRVADAEPGSLDARRRLGYAPSEPELLPWLTAGEHLALLCRAHGLRDDAGADLVERLQLEPVQGKLPGELSSGQRQRLSLATALLHAPAALVLDEPLGSLDPRSVEATVALLRERAAGGTAVLVTSQFLPHVAALADDVVVLDGGRVVLERALADVRVASEDGETARILAHLGAS